MNYENIKLWVTYDPSLESPPPPGQALTYFGSAISDTGFIPVGKYGPTGDAITYRSAVLDVATPREGWKLEHQNVQTKVSVGEK